MEPYRPCAVECLKGKRAVPASTAQFLRRQADNCVRIARQCFDLTASERLRFMAAELRAKADEIEEKDQRIPGEMIGRSGSSNNETERQ